MEGLPQLVLSDPPPARDAASTRALEYYLKAHARLLNRTLRLLRQHEHEAHSDGDVVHHVGEHDDVAAGVQMAELGHGEHDLVNSHGGGSFSGGARSSLGASSLSDAYRCERSSSRRHHKKRKHKHKSKSKKKSSKSSGVVLPVEHGRNMGTWNAEEKNAFKRILELRGLDSNPIDELVDAVPTRTRTQIWHHLDNFKKKIALKVTAGNLQPNGIALLRGSSSLSGSSSAGGTGEGDESARGMAMSSIENKGNPTQVSSLAVAMRSPVAAPLPDKHAAAMRPVAVASVPDKHAQAAMKQRVPTNPVPPLTLVPNLPILDPLPALLNDGSTVAEPAELGGARKNRVPSSSKKKRYEDNDDEDDDEEDDGRRKRPRKK